MGVLSNLLLGGGIHYVLVPMSEIHARKAWRRGKGRSRAAARRRARRYPTLNHWRIMAYPVYEAAVRHMDGLR